jgi:hypothetical protein
MKFSLAFAYASYASSNLNGCSTDDAGGSVVAVNDGKHNRCFSMLTPPTAQKPMPVLFWFHGAGGDATSCGQQMNSGPESGSLAALSEKHGFALVCGNAIDGQWQIPEVFNDTSGQRCEKTETEIGYIDAIVSKLREKPGTYDTSKMFTSGCSMGSAFSVYTSACIEKSYNGSITAFATHSTGLKVKGDGNNFPDDIYKPGTGWGECTNGCKYWPTVVEKSKMKACIFDNKQDPDRNDPFFYRSSVQLNQYWNNKGNKAETHYGAGGHCEIHSFADIVTCLDDGTGRLLPNGQIEATSDSNNSTETYKVYSEWSNL